MTSNAIDIVNPSKKGAARAMIGALKDANLIQKMWNILMHMVLEL